MSNLCFFCRNTYTSLPGEGGRFELNEVKLDKERAFLVIESALRSMGIGCFKELYQILHTKN